MGLSIVDLMTGLFAAFALVSRRSSRARDTGVGRDIDVSLFDCALQNLCYLATWYLNEGHVQGREPRSSHPSLTPSQLYRTRDGFIFIMCNKEKFWPVLCERIGRPEWADDPRLPHLQGPTCPPRRARQSLLDEALSARTTAEWLEHFAGHVPAAPVNDVASALDNPFVRGGERIGTSTIRNAQTSKWSPRRMAVLAKPCRETPRRRSGRIPSGSWPNAACRTSMSRRCVSAALSEEIHLGDCLQRAFDVEQRVQKKREQRRATAPTYPAEKQSNNEYLQNAGPVVLDVQRRP